VPSAIATRIVGVGVGARIVATSASTPALSAAAIGPALERDESSGGMGAFV